MSFLSFIKDRNQQTPAPTSQPKPETAKEMYSRQAIQDKAAARPLDRISLEQMAKVDGIKADLQRATQSAGSNAPSASPAQSDGTSNPQPMAQMSMHQDKAAPALSPTSAQAGSMGREQNSTPKPEKSTQRPQTIARRPPSWER